jgi:hypothetical protein
MTATDPEMDAMLLAITLAQAVLIGDDDEGEDAMQAILAAGDLDQVRALAAAAASGWASLARLVWQGEAEERLDAIRVDLLRWQAIEGAQRR